MIQPVYFFILLAILSSTFTKLMHRYVAKDTFPFAYSWLNQIVATALYLPLALSHFSFPTQPIAWLILIGACVVWTLVDISAITSFKNTEVSLKEPIGQTKLLWALLIGGLILGENITRQRVIGTLIIFFGVCILLWHPERKFGRLTDRGVQWTLGTAVLGAIVVILDKASLQYINPETYGFLVYLGPAILLTFFLPKRIHQVKHLLKHRRTAAFIAIFLAAATYYFQLKAFSLGEITFVYPILQFGTIFAVVAGIFFLGEKEHAKQKIFAAAIVVIGAIVIGK